jgi:hypothetical protein
MFPQVPRDHAAFTWLCILSTFALVALLAGVHP